MSWLAIAALSFPSSSRDGRAPTSTTAALAFLTPSPAVVVPRRRHDLVFLQPWDLIVHDITRLRLNQLFVSFCWATKHSGKASGGWENLELRLIAWSKFGVMENLKLQNHSNNYEQSKNATKMMFFLISGQQIIMKGCFLRNGPVSSTIHMHGKTLSFFVNLLRNTS